MNDEESDFSVDNPEDMDMDNEELGIMEEDDDFVDAPEENTRKRKTPEKKSTAKASKKAKTSGSASTSKKAGGRKKDDKSAPKKELTEKQGYTVILDYINQQNKPFSSQTIFENLHKQVKKAHVVRILAQLAQEGKIVEKEYGKSKIYFADQSQFPDIEESELKQMDQEIQTLTEETHTLTNEVNTLRNYFKDLETALTDAELEKGITTMSEETKQMEERIEKLKDAETIDPKELELLRNEIKRVQKIWRQRRSQCREMVGNLAEGMEKKDEEIIEMIGIETEEELGLSLPFKH